MVFLIQATQNRDATAVHLKLDELIRSSKARNIFADLESATEEELIAFKNEFSKLRRGDQVIDEAIDDAIDDAIDQANDNTPVNDRITPSQDVARKAR
jgi:low affinity Fe/Cu permease